MCDTGHEFSECLLLFLLLALGSSLVVIADIMATIPASVVKFCCWGVGTPHRALEIYLYLKCVNTGKRI